MELVLWTVDGHLERCKAASTNTASLEDDVIVTSLSYDVPSSEADLGSCEWGGGGGGGVRRGPKSS